MKLPSKPMDLSILFCPSKSEKNKNVRASERNTKQSKQQKVRHRLKNTKQEGVLKLRVKINNKIRVYSLGERVNWADWDGKLHRSDFKLNQRVLKVKEDYQTLNSLMTMAGIEVTSDSIIHAFKTLNLKKLEPTYENLHQVNIIQSNAKGNIKRKPKLLPLIEEYMQYCINIGLNKNTVSNYNQTLIHLKDFLKHDPGILAEDFQKGKFLAYLDFLITTKKLKSTSIKVTHFSFIKRMYEHYIDREELPPNKLTTAKFEAKINTDLRRITYEQFVSLYRYQIKEEKYERRCMLNRAKDSYVFSCMTGFHSVEKNNLTSSNLSFSEGAYWLRGKRSKTKAEFKVKLHPWASGIIYKYGIISFSDRDQAYLETLTELEIMNAGIDNFPRFMSRNLNYYLEELSKIIGFNLYTSKMGRKFLAGDSINRRKIPVHVISKVMGVNERTVAVYGEAEVEAIDFYFNNDAA